MPWTGTERRGADLYEAAPLGLRLAAGALDLALQVAIVAGAVVLWTREFPPDLPPRYWNAFDYLVDLANARPALVVLPVAAFVALHLAWETLWTSTLGATPFTRLLGMRACTSGGRRPGPVRAFLRAALGLVLGAAAMVGPAWSIVSGQRRMLHDILTACHVLRGPVPGAWAGGDGPGERSRSLGPSTFLQGPRR